LVSRFTLLALQGVRLWRLLSAKHFDDDAAVVQDMTDAPVQLIDAKNQLHQTV
jgi:hypothetical protein